MNLTLEAGKTASLLADCVSSVFADMAFIDVVRADGVGDAATDGKAVEISADQPCAAIDVLMPLSCRIELRITPSLRDRIVENLFCETPDAVQRQAAGDTLLEMLNIIAGAFLSAYFGSGTDIQLELPRYLYFEDEYQGQVVSSFFMDAEGELIAITLTSVRYRY